MKDTNPLGWSIDNDIEITYNNRDTLCEYKLSLLLRWDNTFNQSELSCRITTVAPDSTFFAEQVVFAIKEGDLCKLSTGYCDSEIDYREGVQLTQKGVYKFVIQPTVSDPVVGIWAVGLNISK